MFNAFTATVHGRVQGVGFRYFVKDRAEGLNLTGWVRNNPDRTVELLVKGPRPSLEQIMQCIRTGPIGSRVERVDTQWVEETKKFYGFEIIG